MKLLILAYDFPPLISIGGQRPYYWHKYFTALGANTTVVTRTWSDTINSPVDYVKPTDFNKTVEIEPNGSVIIRVPFVPNKRDKLLLKFGFEKMVTIRKILTFFYSIFEWLFLVFDAKSNIFEAADQLLKVEKFDLIIATGEPFILFKYANTLSRKYKIPWVADYRDGWTSNQGNFKLGLLNTLKNKFYRNLELSTVSSAKFITTAAPPYKTELQKLFRNKDIEVVYNGYDEDVVEHIKEVLPQKEKFIIAYAGMMYPHQKLETFLEAINELLLEKKIYTQEIEIIFYGMNSYPDSKKRLLGFNSNLSSVITTTNRIPYKLLLQKLKQAHLLLILSQKNANWLNTKVFDYFAVQRPILLVESDFGILDSLLLETASGVSTSNISETKIEILNLFLSNKNGGFKTQTLSDEYKKYSRKRQALLFFDIIKSRMNLA